MTSTLETLTAEKSGCDTTLEIASVYSDKSYTMAYIHLESYLANGTSIPCVDTDAVIRGATLLSKVSNPSTDSPELDTAMTDHCACGPICDAKGKKYHTDYWTNLT